MVSAEDPATVLEQFIHDVANLPAEIQHLMEEAENKESQIQLVKTQIAKRDNALQKFVKLNGSLVANPQEESYNKYILSSYARIEILQEEKIALADKAAALFDRQVKRFDLKLRALEADGQMPPDPQLPSLLRDSPGNLVPPASVAGTGANTPLQPFSTNVNNSGNGLTIANAAIARMQMHQNSPYAGQGTGGNSPLSMLNSLNAAANRAASAAQVAVDKKRRVGAPNLIGNMPTPGVRAGSMGPHTPKAGTPGSRAGSVQPRPMKKVGTATSATGMNTVTMARKQPPPHAASQLKKAAALKAAQKKSRRSTNASPSPEEDDDDDDDDDADDSGEEGGEEESDDTKYCICQSVSYGDMVACDNADCPFQWFHWGCIGMTKEPVGDWLCPNCVRLAPGKIRKAS